MILHGNQYNHVSIIFLIMFFVGAIAISGKSQNIVWVSDTLEYVSTVEIYEAIRRGDHYTKHGKYSVVNEVNQVLVKGNYQQGLKNGYWEYYDIETLKVLAEGNYTNNTYTGTWEYYFSNGETRLIYDFDIDNILYFDNTLSDEFTSILSDQETEIAVNIIERYPTFAHPFSPRTYLLYELQKNGTPLQPFNSNGKIKLRMDMFGFMRVISIETTNEAILNAKIEEIMHEYKALWIPAIIDHMMTEVIITIKF